MKGWQMILQADSKEKKAGIAILITKKVYFKVRQVKSDKDRKYIMKKGTFYQEEITHKYLCTQHRNTKVHKATINTPKRRRNKVIFCLFPENSTCSISQFLLGSGTQ